MREITLTLFAVFAVAACLSSAPRVATAQVRVDRLDRLAAHLEDGPSEGFDISDWSSCAAGRATGIVEFHRDGFRLGTISPGTSVAIVYEDRVGLDACSAFFGLSAADTSEVFLPGSYPGYLAKRDPRVAAAKLRTIADRERSKLARERRHRPPNRASLSLTMAD